MGGIGNLHSKLYYATCLLGADFQPHWWAAPRRLESRIVKGEGVDQATMCGSHKENGHMSPVCWAAVSAVSNYPETQIPRNLSTEAFLPLPCHKSKASFTFPVNFARPQSFMWLTDWGGHTQAGMGASLIAVELSVGLPFPLSLSLVQLV